MSAPIYQTNNYYAASATAISVSLTPSVANMYAVFAEGANGQSTHFGPGAGWTDIGPSSDGQGVFSQVISSTSPLTATATLDTGSKSASGALALIPTSGTPAIIQQASSATPITGAASGFGWRAVFTNPVSVSHGVIAVLTISDMTIGGILWANPVDDENQWYLVGTAPPSGVASRCASRYSCCLYLVVPFSS